MGRQVIRFLASIHYGAEQADVRLRQRAAMLRFCERMAHRWPEAGWQETSASLTAYYKRADQLRGG